MITTADTLPTQYYYFTYDPHADVEALTNATGNAADTYGYTAHGADDPSRFDTGNDKTSQTPGTATVPVNPYRFNGARIDVASGNLNMGARSYDPNINRFLTGDAYSGSGADQGLAADLAGNRYAFAGGNPISNIEIDGHDWKSILGTGLVIGGIVGGIACTIATDGACLAAIGAAAGEGATFGVGGAVGGALTAGLFEGGAAVGASLGIGGAAGGIAAGTVALEESAAADLGAADAGAAETRAAEPAVVSGESNGVSCGGESFTADTQVKLADGSTKAISDLRPGDKVESADTTTGKTADGDASAVWVKHDTDLYDLTIHTDKGDQVVHTTAHHSFFDKTQHKWIEPAALPKGDQLTTDDGSTAVVVGGVAPAKADGDMWDLTIPGYHDFYVTARGTAVLVHNCPDETTPPVEYNSEEEAHHAHLYTGMLQQDRFRATNEDIPGVRGDQGTYGTTALVGVRNKTTEEISIRTSINAGGEAPNSWPKWAKDAFVQGEGHAETTIMNNLADDEEIVFGAASRNIFWGCYGELSKDPGIVMHQGVHGFVHPLMHAERVVASDDRTGLVTK